MKRSCWFPFASSLLLAIAPAARAQNSEQIIIEPLNPEWENEIIHHLDSGVSVGTNGVVVRYGTTVLTAKELSINEKTGDAVAKGDVVLQDQARLWKGEFLQYNIRTKAMNAESFRFGSPPVFVGGENLSGTDTNQAYTATSAFITTDDIDDPAYRIRAKNLKITPGEKVEATEATLYLGKVPVMYLPYYSRRLDGQAPAFEVTPGYRSAYGPFLLSSYNWTWSTNLMGSLNLDYRQKRGVGLGPDVTYDLGRYGTGDLSYYYLRDEDPGEDPAGRPIREDRYRLSFSHQVSIQTNLTGKLVVNKQSDAQVVRDFFETHYKNDPQPKSFLELNKIWPNYSLSFLTQPQLNDFFQTVERLPDIKLSALRQQIGVSPFYYEGESSVGYFRFQPIEGSPTNDYSAYRADTFHQILLPQTYFGWLNFTPRIGGRFTRYGDTHGHVLDLDEQNRAVFNTGAEVSFKASRVWEGARSKFWEVNGLRHIIQPSVNYVFVPNPTAKPRELPQFDTEIPSLRLLPIDFPDYNSIDSIDSQNVIRLGLRNKVQTKREDEIDNIVNWALYTDWRLDPNQSQETFADLYSDLDFKPRSWLILSSELRYDVEDFEVNFANHELTIVPNDVWNVSFGHLYFREDPAFGPDSENNLFRSSFYYRFNENWATRLTHHYEARDGVLEEQYYTVYRDLRSWTAALTFRIRDHRTGPDDFTVAFTFSLKAYPRFGLGKDRARHTMLLGS